MPNTTGNFHPKVPSDDEMPRAQAIPLVELLLHSTMALPPPFPLPPPFQRPGNEEEPRDFADIIEEVLALLDQDDFFDDADIFDGNQQDHDAVMGDVSSANQ